jgi:SAM-dependent methyltransferase
MNKGISLRKTQENIDSTSMSRFLAIDGYEAKRYSFIADFFKEKKGNFLDIGCHSGDLKKYLNNNFKYFATDIMENKMSNYIKSDLNSNTLPFKEELFDGINCSAVLEHLFDPLGMLKEIKRVLKDDGYLLISLPNDKGLNALFCQIFEDIVSYDEAIYGHHWRFSIRTARDFFQKEFKIIKEAPGFGPLYRKYLPFLKFKSLCTEWFMVGIKK